MVSLSHSLHWQLWKHWSWSATGPSYGGGRPPQRKRSPLPIISPPPLRPPDKPPASSQTAFMPPDNQTRHIFQKRWTSLALLLSALRTKAMRMIWEAITLATTQDLLWTHQFSPKRSPTLRPSTPLTPPPGSPPSHPSHPPPEVLWPLEGGSASRGPSRACSASWEPLPAACTVVTTATTECRTEETNHSRNKSLKLTRLYILLISFKKRLL